MVYPLNSIVKNCTIKQNVKDAFRGGWVLSFLNAEDGNLAVDFTNFSVIICWKICVNFFKLFYFTDITFSESPEFYHVRRRRKRFSLCLHI